MSESTKAKERALQLLQEGKIPINEKTGKPRIKDIMAQAGISRSYAYDVRRRYLRIQEAEAGPTPESSDVEIEEKARAKPPPPSRKPAKKEEEITAEEPTPATWEEVMEELQDFEEMLTDAYLFVFGPEGIVGEVLGKDCARPESACRRMAKSWTRYLRRRIDPETLEGYDTYIIFANHLFFVIPIGWKYWQKKKAEKKEAKH